MTEKYDLIFGIGSACSCSQTLRKLNLQFYSYPLDWLYGRDFSYRVDLLVNEFKDFINREDLVFENRWNNDDQNPCDIYKNQRTGIVFNHDFPKDVPLEKSFEAIRSKYERRINRLIEQIRQSDRILVVYVEDPGNSEDVGEQVLRDCQKKIEEKFSGKRIDLLYVGCRETPVDERYGDHIRKLCFDYRNKDNAPPHDARLLRAGLRGRYCLKRSFFERCRSVIFRLKKHLKQCNFLFEKGKKDG